MTDKQTTQKRAPQRKSTSNQPRGNSQPQARKGNNNEPLSRDEKRRAAAIKRRKARKRKKIFAYTIIILILLIVGVTLSLTVFFQIKAITVTGDEIYNYEQITGTSGIILGDNLFLTKKNAVEETIEKNLPYIENAELKRHLAGTMEIKITAAKPAIALFNGESYTLLNSSCKVLQNNATVVNDDVILLTAGEITAANPGENVMFANENDKTTIDKVLEAINQSEMTGITEMDISNASNIKITYNNKVILELGSVESIPSKMAFVKKTTEDILEERPNFEGTINFTIDKMSYVREKRE